MIRIIGGDACSDKPSLAEMKIVGFLNRLVQARACHANPLVKGLAGDSQDHALGSAFEKRNLQLALKPLDSLCQRRLRGADRFGSPAHVSGIGNRQEIIEIFQSHFIPVRY